MIWTDTDSRKAQLEGWDLFQCQGSKDGEWQVQRLDDLAILSDDLEAMKIIAKGNKPHHHNVLNFLKEKNPKEYQKILQFANAPMSVQDMIDELMKVEDKSIHIELFDYSGDRYLPQCIDLIYDGDNPERERNIDINFSSKS